MAMEHLRELIQEGKTVRLSNVITPNKGFIESVRGHVKKGTVVGQYTFLPEDGGYSLEEPDCILWRVKPLVPDSMSMRVSADQHPLRESLEVA